MPQGPETKIEAGTEMGKVDSLKFLEEIKITLENLKREDSQIRSELQGPRPDEENFQSLRRRSLLFLENLRSPLGIEAGRYLAKLENPLVVGFERARYLYAFFKIAGKMQEGEEFKSIAEFSEIVEGLKETELGRKSLEFQDISEKRERAEDEIAQFEKV